MLRISWLLPRCPPRRAAGCSDSLLLGVSPLRAVSLWNQVPSEGTWSPSFITTTHKRRSKFGAETGSWWHQFSQNKWAVGAWSFGARRHCQRKAHWRGRASGFSAAATPAWPHYSGAGGVTAALLRLVRGRRTEQRRAEQWPWLCKKFLFRGWPVPWRRSGAHPQAQEKGGAHVGTVDRRMCWAPF